MELDDILSNIAGNENVLKNEPMSRHTTFKIGGAADYYIRIRNAAELHKVIQALKDAGVIYRVLGNGSNVLVSDKGFHGAVLTLDEGKEPVTFNDNEVCIQAGVRLAKAAIKVAEHGYTGFEFAAGIPGTLGGAVVMNAGAYGQEIKDCITYAVVMNPLTGKIERLSADELELGYRTSIIQKKDLIVLEAGFRFETADKDKVLANIEDLNRRRREKQPLELASAGSTFKRPEGYYAGKLIEDAGLKGYRVGNAAVSEKHCGFVVNLGGATADDVRKLISDVQTIVLDKFGVKLEPEVHFLGE